jgi:predicted nucleic acid-binding protein
VDYLRAELHADWVFGLAGSSIRFLSSVVLMELRLGADTTKRKKAVDRIKAAFPDTRLIAPTPKIFDRAGYLFRRMHGDDAGIQDRLGPINDLLIALTARQIGAAIVTSNLEEFRQISKHLHGLTVIAPG